MPKEKKLNYNEFSIRELKKDLDKFDNFWNKPLNVWPKKLFRDYQEEFKTYMKS